MEDIPNILYHHGGKCQCFWLPACSHLCTHSQPGRASSLQSPVVLVISRDTVEDPEFCKTVVQLQVSWPPQRKFSSLHTTLPVLCLDTELTCSVKGSSAQPCLEGPDSWWHYATGRLMRRISFLNYMASSAIRELCNWSTLGACSLWRQCKSVSCSPAIQGCFPLSQDEVSKTSPLRHSPKVVPYHSLSSKHNPILTH